MTKGKEEFLKGIEWKSNIRASASLWMVYPPVKIFDNYYTDGGLTERIPISELKHVKDCSNHHILIINFKKRSRDS